MDNRHQTGYDYFFPIGVTIAKQLHRENYPTVVVTEHLPETDEFIGRCSCCGYLRRYSINQTWYAVGSW